MPAKSRRKSAASTPRNRGDPALVACWPGAHGFRQLSRYPKKRTKRCGCVHSFVWAKIYVTSTMGYDHCSVPYIPGRHGIPSERTGPVSAHDTSLFALCSPPRELWRSADVDCCCCCCILLQVLRLCCGCCCLYCYNCWEGVMKQRRRFEAGRVAVAILLQTKQKRTRNCNNRHTTRMKIRGSGVS